MNRNATQRSRVDAAILYYDYLLTFQLEVDRLWSVGRYTWASVLFFVNRYLALLGHIPVIYEFFWTEHHPNALWKVKVSH